MGWFHPSQDFFQMLANIEIFLYKVVNYWLS
jgi:hypothetical protein